MKNAIKTILGSISVYLIMAACSGSPSSLSRALEQPQADSGQGSSAGGSTGQAGASTGQAGKQGASGMVGTGGGMGSPVPDAMAQALPPAETVTHIKCTTAVIASGMNYYWAMMPITKSYQELSKVRAYLMKPNTPTNNPSGPIGYIQLNLVSMLENVGVGVYCGVDITGGPKPFDTNTEAVFIY